MKVCFVSNLLRIHQIISRFRVYILYVDKYTDIPLGIYIVRGDNVVLLGEIDEEKSKEILQEVTAEELAGVAEEEVADDKKALVWDFE